MTTLCGYLNLDQVQELLEDAVKAGGAITILRTVELPMTARGVQLRKESLEVQPKDGDSNIKLEDSIRFDGESVDSFRIGAPVGGSIFGFCSAGGTWREGYGNFCKKLEDQIKKKMRKLPPWFYIKYNKLGY